ncbi:unnamed protein product [Blepharisma stoltei]|uniref:Uncharacterized protein n=1 Tax=Blepharisma stoltei TaxID=1481888 RepID=A0AAU9KHK0_9CILI|nr:unnamed protein product [Blepharisma stoltei]
MDAIFPNKNGPKRLHSRRIESNAWIFIEVFTSSSLVSDAFSMIDPNVSLMISLVESTIVLIILTSLSIFMGLLR